MIINNDILIFFSLSVCWKRATKICLGALAKIHLYFYLLFDFILASNNLTLLQQNMPTILMFIYLVIFGDNFSPFFFSSLNLIEFIDGRWGWKNEMNALFMYWKHFKKLQILRILNNSKYAYQIITRFENSSSFWNNLI